MAIKPLGLSPDYKSVISPEIESSLIFSWTYIKSKSTDSQKSAEVKVYNEGSSTALVTIQAGTAEEIDMTDYISKLTVGKTYEWEVKVTSTDNSTASSGKKKFIYADIGLKTDLEWPDGPDAYEYIGTRQYFKEIRENTLLVLADYVINTDAEKKMQTAATKLFTGEIVPSRTDFVSLEEILGFLAEKEMTYKDEVDDLIKDGLGAEDIHKIYAFFDRLTKIPPQQPTNVSMSITGVEALKIESGKAVNSGDADLSINVSWAPSTLKKATCVINVGAEQSEDLAYYELTLTQGYNDYNFPQTLYYRVSDIVSLGRKISITMEHPLFPHLSKSKSAQYAISVVATDRRGQHSTRYGKSYDAKSVPIGVEKYQLRTQRHDLKDSAVLKSYYDIYNGSAKAYVHNVAASATGVYRYAVRLYDINGSVSPWFYMPSRIKIDPLKPPAAPKVKVKSKNTSSITWEWSTVKTADSYEIDPLFGSAGNTTKTGLTHQITGLKENTSYSIRVRAKNKAGVSAWVTCAGKTDKKPIVTYTQSTAKTRTWRTSYEIKYQNGRVTRPAAEYRTSMDGKEVIHGQWIELKNKVQDGLAVKKGTRWGNHKSLFFLDYSGWQSKLKGKEIVSVEFYIKRKTTTHGYPYDGRFLHVYTHNYSGTGALPSASKGPQLGNHYKVTNLDWDRGDGYWVTLPKSYGEKLRDGSIKGIAFHHPTSDQSPYSYMRFDASTFKFRIKYK